MQLNIRIKRKFTSLKELFSIKNMLLNLYFKIITLNMNITI